MLVGDYNIVPANADIHSTRFWAKDALLRSAARGRLRRLLDQDWTDAPRAVHPEEPGFTFWSYLRERWPPAGLRIDHLLLSPFLTDPLADAGLTGR